MYIVTRFFVCVAVLALPTIAAAEPPTAPSELRVFAAGEGGAFGDHYGLRLAWKDNSQNESWFEISDGEIIREVGPQTNFYYWGGMTPGEYKCFKIRAYNDAGSSAWEPNVDPWYRCGTTFEGPTPYVDEVVKTTNYAGYGETGTEFRYGGGVWWVPAVECGVPLKTTRAALWVGLAGKDLNATSTWLVQVGTISQCQFLWPPTTYTAFYQVYRKIGGYSPQVFSDFDVKENDWISAKVSYVMPESGEAHFDIEIRNISQNRAATKTVFTHEMPGVTAENSRFHALCIVESAADGLAQFNTPIEWWGCLNDVVKQVERFDMFSNLNLPGEEEKAWVSELDESHAFTVEWIGW